MWFPSWAPVPSDDATSGPESQPHVSRALAGLGLTNRDPFALTVHDAGADGA